MGVIDLDAPASFGRYGHCIYIGGSINLYNLLRGTGARAHNAAGFGGGGYGSGCPNPRAISHLRGGWAPDSRWKTAGTNRAGRCAQSP